MKEKKKLWKKNESKRKGTATETIFKHRMGIKCGTLKQSTTKESKGPQRKKKNEKKKEKHSR